MALPVPFRMGAEISIPRIDREDWSGSRGNNTSTVVTTWVHIDRAEYPARPRSSFGESSPQIIDIDGDGYVKGKKRNKGISEEPRVEDETLLGKPLLGRGILC